MVIVFKLQPVRDIKDLVEDMFIYLRSPDLSVSLIPSAYEMDHNMKRTCYDKELKKPAVFNISFDTVENILRKIYEKENIEDLLYGILKQRKYKKQLIGIPYLL